jgi:hypothetical protein
MVNRIIGHLYTDQARASETEDDRRQLLIKAGERYLVAGDDGDLMARRHYLHVEGAISAERGYLAGWRFISWNGIGAVDGWLAIAGNYGATVTHGKGIPGLVGHHPLHALVWGILLLGPLLLAVTGWLRGDKPQPLPPPPPRPEPPPPAQQRTPQPVRRPSASELPAPTRRPSSGNQPAPAMRSAKPAIPVPAAGTRTPRPPPMPPAAFRTPRPDLERLRNQHINQNSPQKSETQAYDRDEVRQRIDDETDPDRSALVRRPERDETEAGGNPILPPPGSRPPTPPRKPR